MKGVCNYYHTTPDHDPQGKCLKRHEPCCGADGCSDFTDRAPTTPDTREIVIRMPVEKARRIVKDLPLAYQQLSESGWDLPEHVAWLVRELETKEPERQF